MIKKITITSFCTFYLLMVLGMIFHTSSHPQILGKYTIFYSFIFLFFIISFLPLLFLINNFFKKSEIIFINKKFVLTPVKKILISTLVVFIAFLFIEISLREKYQNYESSSYTYTIDNFHPFLQSQLARQENLNVNSLGFRGEEIKEQKDKNTFRIIVLGGSTVLNREVPFEQNAVRVLEKKLRIKYPRKHIEVINAGKDYYTSEHSLIQYLFKLQDMSPDMIIQWHGINDMYASCLKEGVLTYGAYKADYSHFFGAVSNIVFSYFRPQPVFQIKLVTVDFLIRFIKDNFFSDIIVSFKNRHIELLAKDYLENKNTVTVHEFLSLSSYRRNISMLIELTKERKIPLILGNQPFLFKMNASVEEVGRIISPQLYCMRQNKYYNLESLLYGIRGFNAVTKTVSEENGVTFIDLESKIPKNLEYFVDSIHYTKKGNEVIAETFYKYIVENNLIQ